MAEKEDTEEEPLAGKDPSKVDRRSAAYAARHMAKNLVACRCWQTKFWYKLRYAIGGVEPNLSDYILDTYGSCKLDLVMVRLLLKFISF